MIATWETQQAARPVSDVGSRSSCRAEAAVTNVSEVERIVSGVAGGILLSRLSVRSLPGAVTALVGVGLLYRAFSGHCPIYERLAKREVREGDRHRRESEIKREEEEKGDPPSPATIARGAGESPGSRSFDPAAEEAYWRERYLTRPYYDKDIPFDHFSPAYRYGWESRQKHPTFSFHEVEPQLQSEWERSPGLGRMEWGRARLAALDAWDRADVSLLGES